MFNAEFQDPPHDYKKSLEKMAQGLRKFGGTDGVLLAEFIENVTKDINSMTVGEVKDFHALMKAAVKRFNAAMMLAIVDAYVQAAIPIIEYALFESGTTLALKVLQKIPVSWVYRGARLEKMVKEVGLMGVKQKQNSIRVFNTNTPISTSKELFNTLTKHSISKTTGGKGQIIADMGNGNYITYRPLLASDSGFPATIDLNFKSIWSTPRVIKFTSK